MNNRNININMIGGKSVVWNQYYDINDVSSAWNASISKTSNTVIVNSTQVNQNPYIYSYFHEIIPKDHKVYFRCLLNTENKVNTVSMFNIVVREGKSLSSTYQYLTQMRQKTVGFEELKAIVTLNYSVGTLVIQDYSNNSTAEDYFEIKNVVLIDLTQMFGAGNEPTSTDDVRIKFIESYVELHPEYNGGEIISADVDSVIIQPAVDGIESYTGGVNKMFEFKPLDKEKTYTIELYADSDYNVTSKSWIFSLRRDGIGRLNINNDEIIAGKVYKYTFTNMDSVQFYGQVNYTGTLRNIRVYDETTKIGMTIPTAIRQLNGYGLGISDSIYNYIETYAEGDAQRWRYVQNVGMIDLGSLSWERTQNARPVYQVAISDATDDLRGKVLTILPYTSTKYDEGMPDKSITARGSQKIVYVSYDDITTVGNFKTAMAGVPLYYELKTPIVTDITDLMTDELKSFNAQQNGQLTFSNSNMLPIPYKLNITDNIYEIYTD